MGSVSRRNNYNCFTQGSSEPVWWSAPQAANDSNPNSISVGLGTIIPRWEVSQIGTALRYFVQADTFPSTQDAQDVAMTFQQAADEWNSLSLGFTFTPASTNFHFKIVYEVNDASDADDSCYMVHERTVFNDQWARGYLRSFENPKLSNPPQPVRYRDYEALPYDNGGVHHNSGIPNRAFHKAATAARGPAWDGVGRVWFHAMTDPKLHPNSKFADFAALTIAWADAKYPHLKDSIVGGWNSVGVVPAANIGMNTTELP